MSILYYYGLLTNLGNIINLKGTAVFYRITNQPLLI